MYKKESQGVPGNVLASQAMIERTLQRTGLLMHQLEESFVSWDGQDVVIKSLQVRAAHGIGGEWLGIIKVSGPEGDLVAFQSGMSFIEVLQGISARAHNGSIKFRPDTPYKG